MSEIDCFVGIDLGTTNSVLAYADLDQVHQVLANREGDRVTPSAVCFFDEDTILVGKDARDEYKLRPERTALRFKREMGNAAFTFRPYPNLPDEIFTPEELSAYILKKLKKDAEARLGKAVNDVVITVPAYFRDAERQATIRAGEIAGFTVRALIHEPTAAALAYGFKHRTRKEKVLVYDLGGGTFDVTILEIDQGRFTVIATDGDDRLGGMEFDARIVEHFVSLLKSQKGVDPRADLRAMAALQDEAERAKIRLSNRDKISLELQAGTTSLPVLLTRITFEELTSDLLRRTEDLTQYTLKSANLKWTDIDTVLLVGGSTRMPMTARMLARISGKEPAHFVNPDEAVAEGAALFAMQILGEDLIAPPPPPPPIDVISHSMGVVTVDSSGREINSVILRKNTPLPATANRVFYPAEDYQVDVRLRVTQGEESDMAYCRVVNEYTLGPLEPRPRGKTPIRVTFEYNRNGTVVIRALDESTGLKIVAEVSGGTDSQSGNRITASRAKLARRPGDT